MASIIEELIDVLEKESLIYESLIPIAEEKTKVIIDNDLDSLQEVTEKEQNFIEELIHLEKKREGVVQNMSIVLSREAADLNLTTIISLLKNQPTEHRQLSQIHDRIGSLVERLIEANSRNKMLINESLDMIEFNLGVVSSARTLPGTNTYTKGASENLGPSIGTELFDAKQ